MALISAKTNKKLESIERAMAVGLLEHVVSDEFIFLNHVILDILRLDTANKMLQSSHENLTFGFHQMCEGRSPLQAEN